MLWILLGIDGEARINQPKSLQPVNSLTKADKILDSIKKTE
jgi:hypothetical protein